ncbi:UNVERIFIED_ORG: hypothetical protein BCL66_112117 [Martelella mediterranea]
MVRVIIESPAGDEFYPARVKRNYFESGDTIISGDPLYDLETANGRLLHIHASHSGEAVTSPFAVGAVLSARETLIELNVADDDAPEEFHPQTPAETALPTGTRRVELRTPVDAALYPANLMKVHAEPGEWIDRNSVLYTIEAATGAVVELQMPLSGRILSSNDARNLVRHRAIAVIEPDADDPLAAALGTAQGVYLLADGVFASDEDETAADKPSATVAAARDRTGKRRIGLFAGLGVIAALAVSGWYVLTYVPFDHVGAGADGYYGQRLNIETLGGKRKLFISDEQQRGFEAWLDS